MKYEVMKGCVIKGQPHSVGSIVELDHSQAKELIEIGRIALMSEVVKQQPVEEPIELENRSVGLDASDDAIVIKKKKHK
jgi:hypothetical protein